MLVLVKKVLLIERVREKNNGLNIITDDTFIC